MAVICPAMRVCPATPLTQASGLLLGSRTLPATADLRRYVT
jgi:hypothetical protein